MNSKHLKSVGTMILPCLFAMVIVQACTSTNDAVAQTQAVADPLEGVWAEQVTLRNCDTGAVLAAFRSFSMFNRGDTMSNSSNQSPAVFGPGQGTWTAQTTGYNNVFRFFTFKPDGSFAQTRIVTRAITLGTDKNSFTATISAEIRDTTDAVTGMVCGDETATRP